MSNQYLFAVHHLFIIRLLLFACLVTNTAALTGRTCTIQKSKSVTYSAYQKRRKSQRYSSTCGFWGWSRCARYRDYYVSETIARVRTEYFTEFTCCPGWILDTSGTNCGIHDKFPLIACPQDKAVQATGKHTVVTWEKPTFSEPFGYKLDVTSTFNGETTTLPWGVTTVKYAARSTNNNKQAHCSFTIRIQPPKPIANISGRTENEKIPVPEHTELVLTCRAEYGRPPPQLNWYRNGVLLANVKANVIPSDYLDYKHAVNELKLAPTRTDDGAAYECRTLPDNTKATVTLSVKYEVPPKNTFCPQNISQISPLRYTLISWTVPKFEDPRKRDMIVVKSNIGENAEKHFKWGIHPIVYTATNQANKLKVECKFFIILTPPSCNVKQLLGPNSAAVCSFFEHIHTRVCKRFCLKNTESDWLTVYPEFDICDITGIWRPTTKPLTCRNSTANIQSTWVALLPEPQPKSCTELPASATQSFIQSLQNSVYSGVCRITDCTNLATTCYQYSA